MKKLFTLSLLIFISKFCIADIPSFDVFVFEKGHERLYLRMSSLGEFKSDLCYYDFNGEFRSSALNMVKKHRNRSNMPVFESLIILDFSTVKQYNKNYSSRQVHLKNRRKIHRDSLLKYYDLIQIVKGETYGAKRTEQLSAEDKSWIEQNKLEVLFSIQAGMCELDFISIEGVYSTREKAELKVMISEITRDEEAFHHLLSNLYKSKIFMNGFCSC